MMSRFPLIFRHFLFRSFRDPMSMVFFILLPLGLIVLNLSINFAQMEEVGNVSTAVEATAIAAIFMLAFQFFSSDLLVYNVYDDIRGNVRWRLLAAPVPQHTFFVAAMAASWVFNLLQAAIIMGVSSIAFEMEWGYLWVMFVVVLLVSLIAQLIALLMTQLFKTRKVASGILQGLCFLFMLLSGILFVPLGDNAIATFVQQYGTPLGVAWNAIGNSGLVEYDMSEVVRSLIILGGMIVALAIGCIAASRKGRKA